jgi:hemerythrin
MQATRFSCRKDHTLQHRVVLEVMREGVVQAHEGQLLQVRQMAWQFRDWYHKHVQSMDAALALHLRGARFEPANRDEGLRGALALVSG